MEESVLIKIDKCLICSGTGMIFKEKNPATEGKLYFIGCGCGRTTPRTMHIEDAITAWKKMNNPGCGKPKYHCWNCGHEIELGFSVCNHCGAEIDWR
ncbi:MAG: hypothetical protein J6W04_02080 [Bacteroidales bacterium]|nr:hypothetical protein [Bacteroidales bacterium]